MTVRIVRLAVVSLVLSASLVASGQVTQTGRALDSSFRVGDGRINTRSNTGVGLDSQLYVTGQVTGLAGFRGSVPYTAANQLRLDVPSADLETFNAQSIGIGNVTGGSTYRTNAYFEPSRTVVGSRGLVIGLNRAGSSMPRRTTYSARQMQTIRMELISGYSSLDIPKLYGTTRASSLPLGQIQVPGTALGSASELVSGPGASRLFGMLRVRDREKLGEELYRLYRRMKSPEELAAEGMTEGDESDSTARAGLDARSETDPSAEAEMPRHAVEGILPQAQEDVYMEVLRQLHERRLAEETEDAEPYSPRREMPAPKMYAPGKEAESLRTQTFKLPKLAAMPREQGDPGDLPVVEYKPVEKIIVIHGFAGPGKDMFNKYMAKSQQELKASRFYDAAGHYRLAMTINPNNPLARMGLGVSLFGAGEPLSASGHILRAMRMLPPIMETRLDLLGMMDREIIDLELQRVAEKLVEADDPEMKVARATKASFAFLATFIHQNLARKAEARKFAEILNNSAGPDKLMKAYAQFVLTGKRPGDGGPHKGATDDKIKD